MKITLFLRSLAALFYDILLVLAICMVTTYPLLFFTEGQAISSENLAYKIFLFVIIFAFFVGFWSLKGQTTGMRAWKLKIVALDGKTPSLKRASLRFLFALIFQSLGGLAWIWCLFDEENLPLYDRLAGTRLSRC